MTTFTALAWVYPTTLAANEHIVTKTNQTSSVGWRFTVDDASGNLRFTHFRATTSLAFASSSLGLAVNTWAAVAMTEDQAAGTVAHIYIGNLTTALAEPTYSATTNGSGAFSSDATINLLIGNRKPSAPTQPFAGRIGVVIVWNRVLTLAEIQTQQFRPQCTNGCVLYTQLGWAGTGSQGDLSPTGATCTVTGTTVSNHPPIAMTP